MKLFFSLILLSGALGASVKDPMIPELNESNRSIEKIDQPLKISRRRSRFRKKQQQALAEKPKSTLFYVQLSASEGDLTSIKALHPGVGLGVRHMVLQGALDISAEGLGVRQSDGSEFHWSFPKIAYLYYFQKEGPTSLYLGPAISWGGVSKTNEDGWPDFVGIFTGVHAGCDFSVGENFLGFTEFRLNIPTAYAYKEGDFPGPSLTLSLGTGF